MNQKNAWMDSKCFSSWFYDQFVPSVSEFLESKNLPRKALLLLDNAPSHPDARSLRSGGIRVLYLPPNVTSICQPMDQGVLECLKRKYRRKLLREILEGDDVRQNLRKVDLLNVITWISESWDEIENLTFVKSWRKLLNHRASDQWKDPENVEVDSSVEFDRVELAEENQTETHELVGLLRRLPRYENANEGDVFEWMTDDQNLELTDNDIVRMITSELIDDDDESDGEGDRNPDARVSHADAFEAFNTVLAYVENQDDATFADVTLLRKWRDRAAKKRITNVTQRPLEDFFKKPT